MITQAEPSNENSVTILLRWLAFNVLGWVAGLIVYELLESANLLPTRIPQIALFALIVSGAQWLALRTWMSKSIGWLVVSFLAFFFLRNVLSVTGTLTELFGFVPAVCALLFAATLLGGMQWLIFLWGRVRRSYLWLPSNIIGWVSCGGVAGLLYWLGYSLVVALGVDGVKQFGNLIALSSDTLAWQVLAILRHVTEVMGVAVSATVTGAALIAMRGNASPPTNSPTTSA